MLKKSLLNVLRGVAFGMFLIVCLAISAQTVRAQGTYLYALNSSDAGNRIYGFSVNETTGTLTPIPGVNPLSTGGIGTGSIWFISELIAIDAPRNRLYAVNIGSKTVSAYTIDPATGGLTAMPFSPLPLPETFTLTCTLSVHPSGSPLVVGSCDVNAIASYAITPTTATLVAGNPIATTTSNYSSTFNADGNFYYAGGNNGATSGFSVNPATGALTPLASSPMFTAPFFLGLNTDASGRLFGLAGSPPSPLSVFVINPATGALTAATGNTFSSGPLNSPSAARLSPNQNFYAVVARNDNTVGVYGINGTGTATTMAAVSGSPFAANGTLPCALAYNRAGTYLFVANGNSRNLTTFASDPTTGALSSPVTQAGNFLGTSGRISGLAYYGPVTAPTCGTPSIVNSLVSFTGTGAIAPPTCGTQGYSNDYVLSATITNTGTQTLCGLGVQVVELAESIAAPPSVPFRLISADGATCTGGGLPGSIQSIVTPQTLAPGQSATVDLRIAMPSVRRFRFFVNVVGGIQPEGGMPLNAGLSRRSAAPVMMEIENGRIVKPVNRVEMAETRRAEARGAGER